MSCFEDDCFLYVMNIYINNLSSSDGQSATAFFKFDLLDYKHPHACYASFKDFATEALLTDTHSTYNDIMIVTGLIRSYSTINVTNNGRFADAWPTYQARNETRTMRVGRLYGSRLAKST